MRWLTVPAPTALAKALATSLAPMVYASMKAQMKAQAIMPVYRLGIPISGESTCFEATSASDAASTAKGSMRRLPFGPRPLAQRAQHEGTSTSVGA